MIDLSVFFAYNKESSKRQIKQVGNQLMKIKENENYLTKNLLTYLGNKRKLLPEIAQEVEYVQAELNQAKTINVDLFSGSGSVSRMLKQYSSLLYANDFEQYAQVVNQGFLFNQNELDLKQVEQERLRINQKLDQQRYHSGIITANYAPQNDQHIQKGERCFYSHDNALRIDTIRYEIDQLSDQNIKTLFLANLLVQASIHVNTSGVFKGFYKDKKTGLGKFGGTNGNALTRILGKIELPPVCLSNFNCQVHATQCDANTFFQKTGVKADITYLDPPYNEHPYGSNYFMLNIIVNNKLPAKLSKVSGIPSNWQHSNYNKAKAIKQTMSDLLHHINSKYIILSYNNEGLLKKSDLIELLNEVGIIKHEQEIKYNTFRGSRNLTQRNLHTQEYLFTVKMN